ncbi:ribosomal protein S27, putative [Theileria equi strain WA]|uniref:Ribosomal protein S27, putative n=1 Tax=Theileria equi strain WA TaxID=1537102 RepID=L0B2Z5_THEEQ|nr:ribosomal protein S27, putative [Theileria equi strain WA]AFZ81596.1 ribosomal protein S27, putative [Theileria equi strain WA]|eukprot:XP_004831262.1 ribosomal protein S27, putative [Theileria equi strain WA]
MESVNVSIGHALVKAFDGQTVVCDIAGHETIFDLKKKLCKLFNLDEFLSQSLLLNLSEPNDDTTVVDLLDEDGVVSLHHHIDLSGGAKKRKKKQYTTPKKIKHKKKKVKLAVLKFYKVEGDKVVRLLKECPSESCGSGVFMGSHHNRSYCGRCGLTYILNSAQE